MSNKCTSCYGSHAATREEGHVSTTMSSIIDYWVVNIFQYMNTLFESVHKTFDQKNQEGLSSSVERYSCIPSYPNIKKKTRFVIRIALSWTIDDTIII